MLNFILFVAFLSLGLVANAANNFNYSNVTFNTDLLDAKNKQLVEVGAFNSPGFILPGVYSMKVTVNGAQIGERSVVFYEGEEKDISRLCLTTGLAEEFNLTAPSMARVLDSTPHILENGDICYDPAALDGVTIKAELNKDTLSIVIPQAYRNYVDENWDPPFTLG